MSSALQAVALLNQLVGETAVCATDPAAGIRAHVRDVHRIYKRNHMAGLEVASRV